MAFLMKRWNLYALLFILSFCFLLESANGLHCHVCSSDKLEQCSTFNSPEELPTELCPADMTSCFTKIEGGITVRGCMSRQKQGRCSEDSCAICRSNKCNAQIFPEDRLSCLHCEGSSCVNQSNTVEVRYPCVNYQPDDKCYSVFSNDGSVAYRGCMSDYGKDGRDFCVQNYAQCNICSKRACNSHPLEFEKKISCVKCDPDENSNCNVIDDNKKATECAPTTAGYTNECYIHREGSVSRRGCLYEAPEEIFSQCSDIFSDICTTCNHTDCNRTPIVNNELSFNEFHFIITQPKNSEPIFTPCGNASCTKKNSWERFCYKCDSTNDTNCATQQDSIIIEPCPYAQEDLGCFHMITDSKVVRGCVKNLEGEEKEKCMANDDTCKTCFSSYGCNGKTNFSQCYVTDEPLKNHVLLAPAPNYTKSTKKICKNYDEKCFTHVQDENIVFRGCVESYAAEHDLTPNFLSKIVPKSQYEVCSSPYCNGELDKFYCHSCNSSDSDCAGSLESNNSFRKQCPLEAKPSGCYHLIKGNYVERGCMNELQGDKRAECQSDSDNCKMCIGSDCNNAKNYLRCLWSDHGDYIGISKLCRRYNDQCIIHASKDVILRGCYRDWINVPLNGIDIHSDCKNPILCEKCSTHDCNNRFIFRERCLSCSSNDYFACKFYPNDNMEVNCPYTLQKLGCYHRQDKPFGVVTRGCTSSLNSLNLRECQSTNSTCKTCLERSCNRRDGFQTCTDCSSEIDGKDCMNYTIFLTERTCPNYNDQCYINLKSDVITRNCTDDIVTPNDCNKTQNCTLCSGHRCNGRRIEPEICISCDSKKDPACNSTAVLKEESFVKKCPLSLTERGCYHYMDWKGKHHIRGCVASLSHNDSIGYKSPWKEFRTCKGKKCNSQPILPKCLVCDSTNDLNCATSPNLTHSKVCEFYKNECYTLIADKSIARGCLADDDSEGVREICEKNKVKCEIQPATDPIGLNNSSVNIEETCIECDSTNNTRCRMEPELFKGKICDRIKNSGRRGCYLSIIDDNVKRGCIQDLKNATDCLANSDTCKTCLEKDCNSKIKFQECYSCNSKSDPFCARNVKLTNTEICKPYYSNCSVGIDRSGYIHRQCSDQHQQSSYKQKFTEQFEICEGDKCNGGIYPADILRCYQCTGDDKKCDLMDKHGLNSESCSISSIYDQCFTYIGPDKKMFRGCLSDATNERLLCERVNEYENGTCVKCNTTGCNNQSKFREPTLSCMNCTGSDDCAFGLESLNFPYVCEKQILFGDEETCFTQWISDLKEAKRGCTQNVVSEEDWCKEEEGCIECNESNCNIQNARFSFCVRCESDINGNCSVIQKLDDYIGQCGHSPYSFSRRGCFTDIKNGNITRGCISDLSGVEHTNCKTQETCTLCTEDNCNKEDASSSVKTSSSIFTCSIVILLSYILKNH